MATRSHRFTSYTICHVDESALFEKDERMKSAASKFISDLRNIAAEFPFEYEQVPLECVFSLGNDNDDGIATAEAFMLPVRHDASSIFAESFEMTRQNTTLSNKEKLQCLFEKAESLSAREDLLFYLRQVVLQSVAIRRNCAAIWMADTATRVAIRTINNVAKGRGLALSLETGAQSDVRQGVAFWRPIRDVLAKEIGLYVHYRQLSMPSFPALLHTRRPAKSSIGRLSEEFITGLEKEFASTANTVTRTVGKLTPSSNVDYEHRCALCQI
ncbi:hypothetical protein BDF22DRAFT_377602 [Syncephalis plumigaleata]|nr:hypothetical protein BDF22DRAFT_377602 [Syncephalis plumigaleata]